MRKLRRQVMRNEAAKKSGKTNENFKVMWGDYIDEQRIYLDADDKEHIERVNTMKPKKRFLDNPKEMLRNIALTRAYMTSKAKQLMAGATPVEA